VRRCLLGAALAAAAAALVVAGCGAISPPRPAVVWITVHGLRADAVGFLGGPPGLTPVLDRLASTATWSGSAVAASSETGPATASLLTGLRPWQHQVLHADSPAPGEDLLTLAEALAARGYATRAFVNSRWLAAPGWLQGVATPRVVSRLDRPVEHLAGLGAAEFVWIQLDGPSPPYRLRRRFLSRLPPPVPELPKRLGFSELGAYADPSRPLPAEKRAELWALYCLNVAAVDADLGRLLAALRRGGRYDEALVVIVSDHGQEFGEHGRVGAGGGLGRELLEVPLLLKLPAGARAKLAVGRGERVPLLRLWATVVELAGGEVPPAAAPSLWRRHSAGAPSELYLAGGGNQFSWTEGGLQLRRTLRLERPFRDSLPWSAPPERISIELERWRAEGGSERLDDPALEARLGAALAASWQAFLDEERTPAAEASERGLVEEGG